MPMVSMVLRTSLTSSPVVESLTFTFTSSPARSLSTEAEAVLSIGSLNSAGLSLSASVTRLRGLDRQ